MSKANSIPQKPLVLGVDLGGSKILTAVVNRQGEMVSRDHSITPAARGPNAVIQALLESTERPLSQAGIAAAQLDALGHGAPGLSHAETGVV